MEDIRLFLNDQPVDLPLNVGKLLRMQKPGTDVASLDSRAAESSYTLSLDYTRQNDRVFAHHRDPQTLDKFAPLVPYAARLYVNGNLFFRGLWQLTSIKGGYQGKLVSDEVDVFQAIGTKTLQELAFAPFVYQGRHGFDARLALSASATDVQFPFVAYGNFYQGGAVVEGQEQTVPPSNKVGAPLEVDDYLPSVSFVRTLRQIFADVGWSIRGEVLEQEEVREALLPFTGSEVPWNWGELLKVRGAGGVPAAPFNIFDLSASGLLVPVTQPDTGALAFFWGLQPTPSYNPAARWRSLAIGANGAKRNVYEVRLDGGYRLRARLQVLSLVKPRPVEPVLLQLVRLLAGQTLDEGEVLHELELTGAGTFDLDTDTLSENGLYLETGQRVVAVVRTQLQPPITSQEAQGLRLTFEAWEFEVEPREAWPTRLDVAKLLPAMSQRDFVRGFVSSRNLRFTTDATTRTLTFHYRERYELPAALAVDLTGRCNPEEGEYLPALPARRIVLGWADDESDALLQGRKGFADYTYQPARVPVGVEQEEQAIRLPWAPTLNREYRNEAGGRVLLPCLASPDALQTPQSEVSWNYAYAPRLLVYRGVAPLASRVLSFAFKPTALFGLADFPTSWQFSGPGGLYQRHYAGLFEELLRGHRLRIGVALTPGLYARLTPAHSVQMGGNLYRLGNVPSFTVGGEGDTQLELLLRVPVAVGGGVPAPTTPGGEAQGIEFFGEEYLVEEFY
ncbi:hypothetical protein [Hymenobacter pini]|uniref:hypothetical protein n=1 Tax=Hymenobacter pini TaxID=2880879 RepID=UPI001CF25100|nr:hypothetical protein [Hymenobacter pini]MCA8829430.1 hypothetical protein [Hymenobacter pini]